MSRRDQIRMSAAEIEAFMAEQRVVTCATLGPNGRPHLMPLWYVPERDTLLCWTYAASQKARNLERRPQATLQIEAGISYEELRGVMMQCEVELIRETDRVHQVGLALLTRYAPGEVPAESAPPEIRDLVAKQAPKRLAMRFAPTRTVSWDHRKLGGVY